MPPGHPPKPPQIDPSRSQEATFSLLNFDLIFGSILVPFWLPKCLPFGTLLATKIDQKIDPKSDCLKGRSKIAPRAPKTLPRRPPDPPGQLQDASRTPPGHPQMPSRIPQMHQNVSEASHPITRFQKFEKIEIVESCQKQVEKKRSTTVIHGGHSHRSLKNRKHFHNGRNPKGGGGGRAKRSSIRCKKKRYEKL